MQTKGIYIYIYIYIYKGNQIHHWGYFSQIRLIALALLYRIKDSNQSVQSFLWSDESVCHEFEARRCSMTPFSTFMPGFRRYHYHYQRGWSCDVCDFPTWYKANRLQRFSVHLVTFDRGLFWLHLPTLPEVVEISSVLCLPSSSDVGCFSPQSSFLAEGFSGTLLLSLFLGRRFYNSYL